MSDIYMEYMIKKKPDAAVWTRRVTIWLTMGLVVLLAVASLPFFMSLAFLILPAACLLIWGLKILHKRLNVEYEYTLTNNELDIAAIYGQSRRKKLLTVDCRSFELFAPDKEEYKSEYESQTVTKRLDYSSSPKAERRCFAVFNDKGGARAVVFFEPTDRMKDAMKVYLRNKFKE